MNFSVQPLFPTPVGIYNFDSQLSQSEKDFIIGLDQTPNTGNTTSVQSYLFKEKKLSKLSQFCNEAANHFFQEIYRPIFDVKLKITQAWANYSKKGQWHHIHGHPNSFISGVFYVLADKDKDKIFFHKSGYRQLEIPHDPNNWNAFNSDTWWFPCVENQLILFPSSLNHNVEIVDTDRFRVSLSFNTFPIGILGDDRSKTECILEHDLKKGKK